MKMTVYGRTITAADMETIATYMTDEIRETVHEELAPCTAEEFIARYLELEPEFEELLKNEFEFETEEETTTEYVVEYTDPETGATSPIDNIVASDIFSAEDYIEACENNADQEWVDMLHRGKVTLVKA